MKTFSLEGRAAVVTGSSQGIGHSIAMGLRESGARVLFHGLQERTEAIPGDAIYLRGDLLEDDAAEKLVQSAFTAQPSLDILVCNAGSFFDVPPLEMTRERWENTMALNVTSTFFLTQAFARRLVAEKRGTSLRAVRASAA